MKKLRILFITVIFVIISGSALSQAKQFKRGYEAYHKGEYSNAISYFKECTKLNPNYGDFFLWLSYAYYDNGQYQEAVESFKNALNLLPSKNTGDALYRLASAYEKLGEYDLAISAQKKMIELAPDSSKYFVALSRYYNENKQYDEAITASKRAIELKPDNYVAFANLGIAYGQKKQYDEAIKALKKSIEINPRDEAVYDWMGFFFMEKNAYNEAVAAYKKAIEAAPSEPNLHRSLSRSYYFMGSYDDALAAINKEIELRTIQGGIGISYNDKENYPVVIEINNPGPAKKADLQIGDKIIKINENSTKGWNKEKISSSLRGTAGSQVILTIERSDNKIRKTVTREKIVQKAAVSSIGFRSLISRQKGDFNEAFNDAGIASSLDSSDIYVRLSLGAAYLDRGQYDKSVRLLSQIKDNLSARLLESTAYAKNGKINEAINVYLLIPQEGLPSQNIPLMNDRRVLLQTFKPLVKEHRDKAGSFESKNQYKEALSELTEALKIADDTEAQAILESMFSIIRKNPLLSEVPEDAIKYMIRAEMLIKEGNFEQASTEFKKAIQIAPYIAKLYFNTALMNGELKKYSEAIRFMKIYVQADPDASDSRASKNKIIEWEFIMEKEK